MGLDVSGEDIDAIGFAPYGRLVVSTKSSYSVTGISGKDEDLLIFTATSLGPDTAGTWELYFDGSDVELDTSKEDVNATWIDGSGDIYLSVRGAFTVTGVTGDGSDIFICQPGLIGDTTACTYSMFWDGSANGFGGDNLDGFAIGP